MILFFFQLFYITFVRKSVVIFYILIYSQDRENTLLSIDFVIYNIFTSFNY